MHAQGRGMYAAMSIAGGVCTLSLMLMSMFVGWNNMGMVLMNVGIGVIFTRISWHSYKMRVNQSWYVHTFEREGCETDDDASTTSRSVSLRVLPGTRIKETNRNRFVLYVSPRVRGNRFVDVPQWIAPRANVVCMPGCKVDDLA